MKTIIIEQWEQKKKNVENTKQKKNVGCEEISERKWQSKTQEKKN